MKYDPFARGPAAVGVRSRELMDDTRGGRRIPVEVWYPAAPAHRGEPGPLRDRARRGAKARRRRRRSRR